ncbi:MAG TPA: TAXI family TRAP transporter solute-binding subunit [Azospirillum sp.]|nr:TAXI family TRAP transporter solute-binding subunit [Azospirillum sp.]
MSIRRAVLVLAMIAAMDVAGGRAQSVESTVGVVSADNDPASMRILTDIASALDGESLRILPTVGQGPEQTVADISNTLRGAAVGILPSDVLRHLQHEPRLAEAGRSLRYIARLYDEEVHVLARQDIAGLAALAGKRVNFGVRNGHDHITGTTLFDSLRIRVEPVFLDHSLALVRLRQGEIAALVHVARKPARLFFDLNWDDGVHFLPMPLTAELFRTYLPARLDPADYPLLIRGGEAGRGVPISTVATPMVLAVYDWAPGTNRYRDLSRFTEALFQRTGALQGAAQDPAWKSFNPATEVPGWRRFAPAETWLTGGATAGSGSAARPTARREQESSRRRAQPTETQDEALFRQFLRWQQLHPEERAQRPEPPNR